MSRVAIFVDAGYLFARSSVVLTDAILPRPKLELHQFAIVEKLVNTAKEKADQCSLLRIYWYDGVRPEGLSVQQQALAYADDVKLRLGVVNLYGQQKGVDSLIVTDIVELARNQAISDAVLLSGDEDVRIGVQIAQSFGVRVHLIGIGSGIESQSRTLMQEVDTRTEWSKEDVNEILTVKGSVEPANVPEVADESLDPYSLATSIILDEAVEEFVASISPNQLHELTQLGSEQHVPPEHDNKLLAISRSKLGRALDWSERKYLRDRFKQAAREASQTP